jgi:hypothetical protein
MTEVIQPAVAFEATDCLSRPPNELLDIIALGLCGSRTILDLSCVKKRLCRIAQEAMMRRLCIPKGNGVRQVLEMLNSSSTDAMSSVIYLDLAKYVCFFSSACRSSTKRTGWKQWASTIKHA